MRLIIKSIEADILDLSTHSGDEFAISSWIIRYELTKNLHPLHVISGELQWTYSPDIKEIMDYIRKTNE
jgi:hypothetical protein